MSDKHSTGNRRPAKIPSERRLTGGTQYYEYPNHARRLPSGACFLRSRKPHLPSRLCWPPRPFRQVPWLQMRGDWLAAAGFDIQTPVRVRVMQGCLVVTIDEA